MKFRATHPKPAATAPRRVMALCLAVPAHTLARVAAALRSRAGSAAARRTDSPRPADQSIERSVQRPTGRLRLQLDSGPGRHANLRIELELGQARLVVDEARRWVRRHGLWLVPADTRPGEPVKHPELSASQTWPQAARAIVRTCLTAALTHASVLAAGGTDVTHDDADGEQLHQLRVNLRRLRSALRLIECAQAGAAPGAVPADLPGLMRRVAELFGALGAARDLDVLQSSLLPRLRAAGAPPLPSPPAPDAPPPAETLRQPATTELWLDLFDWLHTSDTPEPTHPSASAGPVAGAAAWLLPVLQRWHRQACRDATRFATLDETQRHTLRKRLKRLRYATEFATDLLGPRRTRRFLQVLARAQTALGDYNDLCTARALYRDLVGQDPAAWFAVGWLSAAQGHCIDTCTAELVQLAKQAPPWRRHDR